MSKSNLGAMIDDDDGTITEAQLLRQQREEVAMLKEQLNQKVSTPVMLVCHVASNTLRPE